MTPLPSAGVSLKPEHYAAAREAPADGLWFEVHPENYMVDGGPRLAWLDTIRDRHPIALHGVSLSLAADAPPDGAQLTRLATLVRRFVPAIVSEHLAWSAWRGVYHPDLLPFPRTGEALRRIADNVGRAQDALGRRIAIENPAHYVDIDGHAWDEIDFLAELARRSGCALLVDVNNVFVGARNLGYAAEERIDRFPGELVMEVHVAGHAPDPVLGNALLVDSHDAEVAPEVWALYERLIRRIGPRPTLVERDANLPGFDELLRERAIAQSLRAAPAARAA
jgi:uncharacterized protein (UPF0276 family)